MPQVGNRRFWIAAVLALALWGCGSGSDSGTVFVPGQGHPGTWASPLSIGTGGFHGTAIKEVPPGPVGSRLFLFHCAACHGEDARGKIGINIRGATLSLINAMIDTIPLMKGHSVLSQEERQEIADYLSALANNSAPVSAVIHTELCAECHGSDLDGGIARVGCFSCHRGTRGDIGHPPGWNSPQTDPAHFHGRYGKTFVVACSNCHGADPRGRIGPLCQACHNGVNAPVLSVLP